MSKKKWCGLLAILMAVSIVFTSGALRPVNVYAETIADLQEQSEEHQKKLEEINQRISTLFSDRTGDSCRRES